MNKHETKLLIIPAKYFLHCIADDKSIQYPIHISLIVQNGGFSRSVHSSQELKKLCSSRDIFQSSVVRADREKTGFYVELMKDGCFPVRSTVMPERKHMETLIGSEVVRLYSIVFS